MRREVRNCGSPVLPVKSRKQERKCVHNHLMWVQMILINIFYAPLTDVILPMLGFYSLCADLIQPLTLVRQRLKWGLPGIMQCCVNRVPSAFGLPISVLHEIIRWDICLKHIFVSWNICWGLFPARNRDITINTSSCLEKERTGCIHLPYGGFRLEIWTIFIMYAQREVDQRKYLLSDSRTRARISM